MNPIFTTNVDNYSDLIDMLACTVFGTGSIVGTTWLIINLVTGGSPAFIG